MDRKTEVRLIGDKGIKLTHMILDKTIDLLSNIDGEPTEHTLLTISKIQSTTIETYKIHRDIEIEQQAVNYKQKASEELTRIALSDPDVFEDCE